MKKTERKQLYTRWGRELDREQVWQEYPRPQMVREDYTCLNGMWEYAFSDHARRPEQMEGEILVPFSPEAALSGVNRQLQPEEYLWYRRVVQTEIREGCRLLLHFGAVDQACKVYVNEQEVTRHTGGYLPFCVDVTSSIHTGENVLELVVQDLTDTSHHARGKQKLNDGGMFYTAQSGIWQTVWMEWVPKLYAKQIFVTPQYDRREVEFLIQAKEDVPVNLIIYEATLFQELDHRGVYGRKDKKELLRGVLTANRKATLPMDSFVPWSPKQPYLYPYKVQLGEDVVEGYFAMRTINVEEDDKGVPRLFLNHESYLQRGVLDQGYWPDGLYTAPSDEALLFDIREMKRLGFNMLRKHAKLEMERWYFHCDRLGMLVWQDMVNGGESYRHWFVTYVATLFNQLQVPVKDRHHRLLSRRHPEGRSEFEREMGETITALKNHPSIVTWVIFNEGWGQFDTEKMTNTAKEIDPTRLIDSASGWFDQKCGDINSLHHYFFTFRMPEEHNRAMAISEYGGYTMLIPEHCACEKVYGYHHFRTMEDWREAYDKLEEEVIQPAVAEGISALVYTQLSDVEEEVNGILTYDREINRLGETQRTSN